MKNRRVPLNRTYAKTPKPYFLETRYRSRLFFAFRIGELQFKDFRRGEFTRKFGDTKCFMPNCDNADSLVHVMECKHYPPELRFNFTNYNYDPIEQVEFINYLEKLDKFRALNFGLPVIYRPSLKAMIEKQLKSN